ncbi:unnamed protein product [Oncorhynchus mykiss]|uniref:Uncharacterized protein n=1 Tax=Oncorhynchus mykiss TaxID=8022 RepID=A0A060WPJ4_ONCMY|nr:unnamed protein product [Oncorhynchus mykiss]
MAEGGEGEDEIQFLRTVSSLISVRYFVRQHASCVHFEHLIPCMSMPMQ